MAHNPAAAAGSYLQMGSPLVTIDGVLDITVSGGERPSIDMTPINATTGVAVVGIPAFTTMAVKLAWDPANTQHAALLAAFVASVPVAQAFSMVYSDAGAASRAFTAYVSNFPPPAISKSGGLEVTVGLTVATLSALVP
jgi:hypothetical protein